jgi:hypothetical protein
MIRWDELISACETDLRRGLLPAVVRRLQRLRLNHIPRERRVPLANIARRAHCYELSLRIITPSVRDAYDGAGPDELLAYAAGLQRLGVIEEAITLLRAIDPQRTPAALLQSALCEMARWDYTAAIPYLKAYRDTANDDYQRLVAGVNLAAALAAVDDLDGSLIEVERGLRAAAGDSHRRLRANLLEIRAQVEIARGDFKTARINLDGAGAALGTASSQDLLFIQKWRAVAAALETSDPGPLRTWRLEAVRQNEFESVREADLFLLRIEFSRPLFEHLYAGTPFPSYRERLIKTLAQEAPAAPYRWGAPQGPALDLASGRLSDGGPRLQPKLQLLVEGLVRDLYRPATTGALFARVFPGERFDIFTSPNRLHQLLWRLRDWISRFDVPLTLTRACGGFRLEPGPSFALAFTTAADAVEAADGDGTATALQFRRLRAALEKQTVFRAADVEHCLACSRSSAQRLTRWGLKQGHLTRHGRGSSCVYRFAA